MMFRYNLPLALWLCSCCPAENGNIATVNSFHIEVGSLIVPVDFKRTVISSETLSGYDMIYVDSEQCGGTRITLQRENFEFLSNALMAGYTEFDQGVYRKSKSQYLTPSQLKFDNTYVGPLYFVTIQAVDFECASSLFEEAQLDR